MKQIDKTIDWELCTAEGSIRNQLDHWRRLTLLEKLEALDEMCEHARATIDSRRRRGLPYIDPYTGELVSFKPLGGLV